MTMFLRGRRSYSYAAVLAILLHLALGYGLWILQDELTRTSLRPPSMTTRLVNPTLTPLTPVQTSLIIERPAAPQPKPVAKQKPTQPKKAAPPKPKAKPKAKETAKPKPKPKEIKRMPRTTDELDALVRSLNTPAKPTTAPTPAPQPITPEMRVANRFVERIQRQIESAWIQPPSIQYREMAGLKVLIRLTLESGGRLINARILSSSGNTQFDRSALNAVYKVGRFEVPNDAAIFDRFFRQVNINYSL